LKKIKTQNKQEEIQDISSSYGVDIEEQLTSMLSEELAKSIDREILTSLGIELDRWKRRKTSIGKIFSS
jgi:hypothetical protein